MPQVANRSQCNDLDPWTSPVYAWRTNQRNSAPGSTRSVIAYAWHPLYGQEVAVIARAQRKAEDYILCRLPSGLVTHVPLWMTDAADCARHRTGAPQASQEALVELRRVLDALMSESPCDRDGNPLMKEDSHGPQANSSGAVVSVPMSGSPTSDSGIDSPASHRTFGNAAQAGRRRRANADSTAGRR